MLSFGEPATSTEGGSVLDVEVAYALPEQQFLLRVRLRRGTTVRQAIDQSGILDHHPDIDLEKNQVGIFGKLTKLDAVLRDGDRVEIYRPLIADPKEVRRLRAAQGKGMKKAGGELKPT